MTASDMGIGSTTEDIDAADRAALAAVFLEELPAYRAALAEGTDATRLQALCHELGTTFALVGATSGARLARTAEAALRARQPLRVDVLQAMLQRELDRAAELLGGSLTAP